MFFYFGEAGVDDVSDPRDSDGGLGDVGCEDDFARVSWSRREDQVLGCSW